MAFYPLIPSDSIEKSISPLSEKKTLKGSAIRIKGNISNIKKFINLRHINLKFVSNLISLISKIYQNGKF